MNNLLKYCFILATVPAVLAAEEVTVVPRQIPGSVKADSNVPSAGYGSSTVQAQLRIDVKERDKAIRFIRSNTDPFVVTRAYVLKHAEPYALRGYLLMVVKGTKVDGNPVQVDAIKFNDGRGVLLVSAEDYRFEDHGKGDSIDEIIAKLDQPNMTYSSGRPQFLYFPKVNAAANLKEMVHNVGTAGRDFEFTGGTDVMVVDGGFAVKQRKGVSP